MQQGEPNFRCLECGETISPCEDLAHFAELPGRYFHTRCREEIGDFRCWLLASTAPDSAWQVRG